MDYKTYVKDTFIENQMNYGAGEDEALDAFNSQPFEKIEKWLIKSGFDLENEFKYFSS